MGASTEDHPISIDVKPPVPPPGSTPTSTNGSSASTSHHPVAPETNNTITTAATTATTTSTTTSSTNNNTIPLISFMAHSRGYPPDGGEFEFAPPPEAPIFRPTEEEFAQGPLHYVASIKHIAEPHGICKIIPPPSFKPPFAVDPNFRFTPRVQRLNELEAGTRMKFNFLEQLLKFWDLQGSILKIPTIDKKILDLYQLHKVVQEDGGFETCTRDKKWSRVATKMNLGSTAKQTRGPYASLLRQHYEKILFPYDVFLSGATIVAEDLASGNHHHHHHPSFTPPVVSPAIVIPKQEGNSNVNSTINTTITTGVTKDVLVTPLSPHDTNAPSLMPSSTSSSINTTTTPNTSSLSTPSSCSSVPPVPSSGSSIPTRMNVRRSTDEPDDQPEPKMLRSSPRRMMSGRMTRMGSSGSSTPPAVPIKPMAPTSGAIALKGSKELKKLQSCVLCFSEECTSPILQCVDCGNSYHIRCLIPPLNDVPKGSWHCPRCLAYLVQSQPQPFTHEFGFVQSQRHYTLEEFHKMADNFKRDYFRMEPRDVPLHVVEREFWRILNQMEDTVTVEYGADLHTTEYGSGFNTPAGCIPDLKYLNHPWNLNNLPILEGSVFKYINADISGMIVPWMYVGMCFSTFCWHNEDHWSYSINYLHFGEPKSWYGVPGEHADTFERAMKRVAPALFETQPDLLHQLVTICNPNILMSEGVPIYKVNQREGEFVITFPRAYHAGYNQGMNFAEAVNFAPADWLPIGRVSVSHYSMLHRYPVFSHDELICKMATDSQKVSPAMALATYMDMIRMVKAEKTARLNALEWGVKDAEREKFELLADDARQCDHCKTSCFLSAITCPCSPKKLVCIPHRDHLCDTCPPLGHKLKYRYTLDEIPILMRRLKARSEESDDEEGDSEEETDEEEEEDKEIKPSPSMVHATANGSNSSVASSSSSPSCSVPAVKIESV